MKRVVVLLLVLCTLLCACKKKQGDPDSTTQSTGETTQTTTEATTEATTEDTTEPASAFSHPLTGQGLDIAWEGRVTAIVINNLKDALPHHGVSQADMIYEIETEGGITRMLAIFSSFANVESIGPVRSGRSFFNNVAVSFDAPLIHCGGSQYGLNGNYDDTGKKIPDWKHIDATYYEGVYFFRDKDRYNYGGYAWEHTLFTNGEKAQKALEKKGYDTPSVRDYGLDFGVKPKWKGEKAESVTVTFRGGKTSEFAYNKQTGLYDMSQYKATYVDANTGEQMAFRNVIVVYADQWFVYDGVYNRSFYNLLGSGQGLAAVDGKIVPITWHREKLEDPFSYTLEDGTDLTLGVGKTYVAVCSPKKPTTYK